MQYLKTDGSDKKANFFWCTGVNKKLLVFENNYSAKSWKNFRGFQTKLLENIAVAFNKRYT